MSERKPQVRRGCSGAPVWTRSPHFRPYFRPQLERSAAADSAPTGTGPRPRTTGRHRPAGLAFVASSPQPPSSPLTATSSVWSSMTAATESSASPPICGVRWVSRSVTRASSARSAPTRSCGRSSRPTGSTSTRTCSTVEARRTYRLRRPSSGRPNERAPSYTSGPTCAGLANKGSLDRVPPALPL